MIVRFVLDSSDRYYSFSAQFVERYRSLHPDIFPTGIKAVYGSGTEMFSYLDSLISPSDLKEIISSYDGNESRISLVFDIHLPLKSKFDRYILPIEVDLLF